LRSSILVRNRKSLIAAASSNVLAKRFFTASPVVHSVSLKNWKSLHKSDKRSKGNNNNNYTPVAEQDDKKETEFPFTTDEDENQLSYVQLFKKQLSHLRATNQEEAAVSLFSEISQTGLPIPCSLYQEVFLALNGAQRYFQVENIYQEMRQDGIVPSIGCFYTRLQALIGCMDRAREKGEMLFWLDKKLRDICDEVSELNFTKDPKIYGALLQLGSKGNTKEILLEIWNEFCRLFPYDAPHPRVITNTIRSVSERFEDAAAGAKILADAQEKYGYSVHNTLLSSLCFRALNTNDDKTALSLIHLIIPPSIKLYQSALRCAAQTGSTELLEFAWPRLQAQAPALASKLLPWVLYALSKSSNPRHIIDYICAAPPESQAKIQYSHFAKISQLIFDSAEQIDDTYYYCEQKENISVAALDFIIISCGVQRETERAIETYQAFSQFNLKPLTSTYNAMMYVYYENEDYHIVGSVFEEILQSGNEPDEISYECLVRTYLQTEEVKLLLEAISTATEKGKMLPFPLYDEVIRYFIDQGNSSASQFVLRHMKQLHIDTSYLQQLVNNTPMKLQW